MSMEKDILIDLYEKFNIGDIPSVLKGFTEDAKWATPPNVPWTKGTCQGRDQIAEYFKAVGENHRSIKVMPREFVQQGNQMIVAGYLEGTAIESGINYATRMVHIMTWENQRIAKFEDIVDAAEILKAF